MIRLLSLWFAFMLMLYAGQSWSQPHGHSEAKAPALAVSAAFDAKGSLWLVGWHGPGALYVQRVLDQGRRVDDAKRLINVTGDAVSASGENRPKIK
ncbi:MAG: hypothetical protein ACO31J_12800, partial [Burkholderiaceae bacterium]